MAKNDSKVEALKVLSKYIKDGIIDDAIYQAYIDAAKAYGATQKEIGDAIQSGKRAIEVAQKTSQEAVQVGKNAEKIATQSAELISSVNKTQSIVEEKLAKLSRRVKREQENLARNEQKKSTKFRGLGRAGVRLIPGIDHEYEHTATQEDKRSQIDKAKLDKMIDKQHRLSVTKIASILTQSDEETLQRLLDSMKGKELTPEYKNIKGKLREAKKIHSASAASSVRGTGFHKLAETIEKGGFSMDDFDITDGEALAQKIKQLKTLSKQTGYEDIDKALNTFDKNIKTIDQNAERLIKMAQSYENFKKEVGLKGQVTTERSVGFLTQIGDEWVEVVGTLDSFFNELKVLTDFKTGQSVDPKKIGIQTNLLKTALKTMGVDVKGMKALHIPYKSYREGGVYDVKEVNEDTVYQWVADAFNMYWGKQTQPTKSIPTLMHGKLEPYETKTGHSWKINKRTLKSLEEEYEKGWVTADEVVNMVESLSPDDRNHFMNLLWSTKKYGEGLPEGGVESDELYRSAKLWKELRAKLPSFYTGLRTASGVSEETFIDEEGNVSGATTVGGGFLSQWSKAYRLKLAEGGEKAAQTVVDQFVKIVRDSTDEIGRDEIFGKLSSLSFKDDIHDSFIDAVDKSLFGEGGSSFYSGNNAERVSELKTEVETLVKKQEEISKSAAEQGNVYTDEQLKEYRLLSERIESLNTEIEKLSYGYSKEPTGVDQVGINERSKEENAARAIRSQKRAGERYYREQGALMRRLSQFEEGVSQLDSKTPEQVLGFVKGIGSLKSIFQGALNELDGEGMSQLNEAGMPEFIENSEYLLDRWYQFVRTIKEKIKPIEQELRDTARETGDWSKVNTLKNTLDNLMLTEDLSSLGVKTAHRFSWLYQAKDIYDEMLQTELPKDMTVEEYAKQRLSEGQYEQYLGSIQLRAIAERSGGSLEELINNFLKAPIDLLSSELAKDIQDSLFKIKEGAPELLSGKFYDIISEQTTIAGGESKKLEWWRNVGAVERLRRGEEIKAWDPRKTQEISVSDKLTTYLDEEIRKTIDNVTKAGITASAQASLELKKYLSQIPGIMPGEIRQLYAGGNVDALINRYGLTPDTEAGKKYAELSARAKGIYTETTEWTRESVAETLKDAPEKLASVLQLIDIYERVKNLPTVTVGPTQEEKVQTAQVETPKADIDANTVIIGEPDASTTATTSSTSATGAPKKKKTKGRHKKSTIDKGGIQSVYATSDDIADLSKTKAASITTDYEGHTIGKTYKYLADKVFADYGPGGLAGWIDKARQQGIDASKTELIDILTKVPSYKKASGGLSKAGRTAFDEIMTDAFGDKYQPQSGSGAILSELKGIHKDTSSIEVKVGLGGTGAPSTMAAVTSTGTTSQTTSRTTSIKPTDKVKKYLEYSKTISDLRVKQQKEESSLGKNKYEVMIEAYQKLQKDLGDFTDDEKLLIQEKEEEIKQNQQLKLSEVEIAAAKKQTKQEAKDAAQAEKDRVKSEKDAATQTAKTAREYQRYLDQRFSILSKIESAQAQYNISTGKERIAAEGVITQRKIELDYLDQKNSDLIETMANTQKATKADLDYAQSLRVASMQQEKLLSKKGAKSLWDVMGNDI
mgnify:CR=1 FL=1